MSQTPPPDLRTAILGELADIEGPPHDYRYPPHRQGLANTLLAAAGSVQGARSMLDAMEVNIGEALRQLAEEEAQSGGGGGEDDVAFWLDGPVVVDSEGDGDGYCDHDWLAITTMGGEAALCGTCGRQLTRAD